MKFCWLKAEMKKTQRGKRIVKLGNVTAVLNIHQPLLLLGPCRMLAESPFPGAPDGHLAAPPLLQPLNANEAHDVDAVLQTKYPPANINGIQINPF